MRTDKFVGSPAPVSIIIKELLVRGKDDAARILIKASEEYPLRYKFVPTGKHSEILEKISCSLEAKNLITKVMILGGNGIGKTLFLLWFWCNWALGKQSSWFPDAIDKRSITNKVTWYITSPNVITEVIIPYFEGKTFSKGLLNDVSYTITNDGHPRPYRVSLSNGHELVFLTNEQGQSAMTGAQIGLLLIDEPPEIAVMREAVVRLRTGGICLMMQTSLRCDPTIINSMISEAEKKNNIFIETGEYPNCHVIYYDLDDTVISDDEETQKIKRGFRTPKEAEAILDLYDENEREARRTGVPLYNESLIYNFTDEHIEYDMPDFSGRDILQTIDPHDSRMCAALYSYIDDKGVIHVFAEKPAFNGRYSNDIRRPKDYSHYHEVKDWLDWEDQNGIDSYGIIRIVDPHMIDQTRGGTNFRSILTKAANEIKSSDKNKQKPIVFRSLPYIKHQGKTELETGHAIVSARLHPLSGRPTLKVYSGCINLINAMRTYRRVPESAKVAARNPFGSSRVGEIGKDWADNIHMIVTYFDNIILNTKEIKEMSKYLKENTGVY